MMAVSGPLPSPTAEWRFEFKWDGMRVLAYAGADRTRLLVRSGQDRAVAFPELAALGEALNGRGAVLDGEVIALDGAGRPSFEVLQPRMNVSSAREANRLATITPVRYVIFDVVFCDGAAVSDLSYLDRRELLCGLGLDDDHWSVGPAYPGPGADLLAVAAERGLEGVVAKRADSRYYPGHRTREWVKVKLVRTQEVVVGGWTQGKGTRVGSLGALLVGVPGDGGLVYAGKVGTGFDEATLADLGRRLEPLQREDPPFAGVVPRAEASGATWVEPRLVGEVRFTEWTAAGRLRQPAWRGLRPDKAPGEVVRES